MTRPLDPRSRSESLALVASMLASVLLAGCRARLDAGPDTLEVDVPSAWSQQGAVPRAANDEPWWRSFESEALDAAVARTLDGSFELQEAWSRLAQAEASARISGAARFPTLDANGSAQQQRIDTSGSTSAGGIPIRLGETYSLGASLGYELDLFGRIAAGAASARLEGAAAEADVRATALTLSGRAVDAWLTLVENRALLDLARQQVAVGDQLLEVTRNRFAAGTGAVLDVLQQQRQLEATRAELPRFEGEIERAQHLLNVLAGRAPRSAWSGRLREEPRTLPALPPLGDLRAPVELLDRRPDLVAALRRVERADRDVAVAIADRYPRLSLSGSYNFDGNAIEDIFDRTIRSIAGSLVFPLIDGGRRRAELDRQKAALEGSIAALQGAFVVALQEVEDALSVERRGLERVATLELQATTASQEVEQATRRYVGGVGGYLVVLTAIQNEQTLQRQLVSERAGVLRGRAQLLRALGGPYMPADHHSPGLTSER